MTKLFMRTGIFALLLIFAVSSLPAKGPQKEGEMAAKGKKKEMSADKNKQDVALGRYILKQIEDGKSGEELGKAIKKKADIAKKEDNEMKGEKKEGSEKKGKRTDKAEKKSMEGSMKKGDSEKKDAKAGSAMKDSAKKGEVKAKRPSRVEAVSDLGKLANKMIAKGASNAEIAAAVEKEAAKIEKMGKKEGLKEKKEKGDKDQ